MGYLSCRTDSSTTTCRSISKPKPKTPKPIAQFSYHDLESATQNFSPSCLLGRGSHGSVYKAVLPSGTPVAVKRPSPLPLPSPLDNEFQILSLLHHPLLVNLLGFSSPSPSSHRLLVFEFMPNGSLYNLLHSSLPPPSWPRRLRFALQTAKALLALHRSTPPIIHRDVKSANVLLDQHFNARLADFGLALKTHNGSTPPAGTLGYLDPAYVTPDGLSTKTDVFSFGILLLEIMSGRKAIDVRYSPASVVDWAVPMVRKGKGMGVFDPRIGAPRDAVARRELVRIAVSCVRSCGDRRPGMAEVVERLRGVERSVGARVWGVGAPCAVVDTESRFVRIRFERKEKGEGVRKCGDSFSSCSGSPPLRGVERNNELVGGRSRRLHVVPDGCEDEVNSRRN